MDSNPNRKNIIEGESPDYQKDPSKEYSEDLPVWDEKMGFIRIMLDPPRRLYNSVKD